MRRLQQLVDFIRRDTADENEAAYFLVVLRYSFCLMMFYYLFYIIICMVFSTQLKSNMILAVPWLGMMTVGFVLTYHYSDKTMFLLYSVMIVGWTILSIYSFGWNTGGQQFLLPLLVMVFFCVHYSTARKIVIMCLILALRLWLFMYCQKNPVSGEIQEMLSHVSLPLQILNSVFLFLGMTITGLNFSSSIQGAEKKLLRANEKLKNQASTDPLTGLPNRRKMVEIIQKWTEANPTMNFSFAMADIDFFKRINDTWGHDCGDEVLKKLAELFEKKVKQKGYVCRWGGEEFFFFFPEMNLDVAAYEVKSIQLEVRKLEIPYEDETIRVTMTFGVEENDFQSDLQGLIRQADEKLYYGKDHGRNCVIS